MTAVMITSFSFALKPLTFAAKIARLIAVDPGERFVDAPDKFDFHEYRQMERFIGTVKDRNMSEQLRRAIKGKGAFRYFKDNANRLGILKDWVSVSG